MHKMRRRKRDPIKERDRGRKYRAENADRINERRRERRANNENGCRDKAIAYEKRYKDSGHRAAIMAKPENREKARLRSKEFNNSEFGKAHNKEYNAKYRIENKEKVDSINIDTIEELRPSYVASCMRISVKDLDPKIYQTKKIIIKLKREIRNQKTI